MAERSHYSKRILDAAERAQNVSKFMTRIGAGTPSPAYVQLNWHKQPHISPDALKTVSVPGDKRVLPLAPARFWKNAAVLSVRSTDLNQIKNERSDYQDAVAYVADDVVRVGFFPEQSGFHSIFQDRDSVADLRRVRVGMRIARGPLVAAMGVWDESERQLIVPDSLDVTTTIHVKDFSHNFPGAPLV